MTNNKKAVLNGGKGLPFFDSIREDFAAKAEKNSFIYDRKSLFHNISIDCLDAFSEIYSRKGKYALLFRGRA